MSIFNLVALHFEKYKNISTQINTKYSHHITCWLAAGERFFSSNYTKYRVTRETNVGKTIGEDYTMRQASYSDRSSKVKVEEGRLPSKGMVKGFVSLPLVWASFIHFA